MGKDILREQELGRDRGGLQVEGEVEAGQEARAQAVEETSRAPTEPQRAETRVESRNLRPIPQLQIERPEQSPVSIDRAIGVVLLALCLMILKKVFYPGSTGSLFGGSDELHMIRE